MGGGGCVLSLLFSSTGAAEGFPPFHGQIHVRPAEARQFLLCDAWGRWQQNTSTTHSACLGCQECPSNAPFSNVSFVK